MIWGDVEALAAIVARGRRGPRDRPGARLLRPAPGLDGAAEESWRAVREGIERRRGAARRRRRWSARRCPSCSTTPPRGASPQAGDRRRRGLAHGRRCAAARDAPSAPATPAALRAIARRGRARGGGPARRLARRARGEGAAARAGVAVVEGRLVADERRTRSPRRPSSAAPVALKLSAARVQHKSEIGALELGLDTPGAVAAAHRRLAPLAAAHGGALLVERMAAPGVELIVAARRDAVVPALVVGLGGIWTELLDDVAIVPLPRRRGADRARARRAARRGAAARRPRPRRRSTSPRRAPALATSARRCSERRARADRVQPGDRRARPGRESSP